jgi:hypothetical protein
VRVEDFFIVRPGHRHRPLYGVSVHRLSAGESSALFSLACA